ncbi:MAG: SDR family NAD(P)-dependent oxidoreductase [Acetobacteraceae bacterium]|nr:SDR family NAD(P)-dependent oxidoreductase [Acetobacteraceae bacterium]
MTKLTGKIAWVTGAGTGIGEAAATVLAEEGATVVLSGRRRVLLEGVAARIMQKGGNADVQNGDMTRKDDVARIAKHIKATHGRLDILVNNAGVNITPRHWNQISYEGIETMLDGNLTAAAFVAHAALEIMRPQGDGLLVHTASMAGRNPGGFSGPLYGAAKHGVVAMSHTINMEECINGIRSTVFLPGEVATPILDSRPNPVSPEMRALMVQSEDCGNLICYIACLPRHLVMNEVWLSPRHNRKYVADLQKTL